MKIRRMLATIMNERASIDCESIVIIVAIWVTCRPDEHRQLQVSYLIKFLAKRNGDWIISALLLLFTDGLFMDAYTFCQFLEHLMLY